MTCEGCVGSVKRVLGKLDGASLRTAAVANTRSCRRTPARCTQSEAQMQCSHQRRLRRVVARLFVCAKPCCQRMKGAPPVYLRTAAMHVQMTHSSSPARACGAAESSAPGSAVNA